MSDIKVGIPTDARGNPFDRAQDLPIVCDDKILGSATKYADIFDLNQYPDRAFIGILVRNPSASESIQIAIGDEFTTAKCIVVSPNSYFALDDQFFGSPAGHNRLRAKLDVASGTLASGTFSYAATQPANGNTVVINGTTYEFSSDASAAPGNIYVQIGASADASWTNLMNAVNATDQAVTASINTGTDVLTITSNYGGSTGNAIGISTAIGGVTVSGANLAGGVGGVLPVFHIW